MVKKLLALAASIAFALPLAASAASISSPLFSNGDTTIDATGGSTVSGTFTLTVGGGEVCEWLRTQSDPSQPFTDTSVGGQLGYQEQVYINVPFSVKVPPNTGTVYPTVQCAGAFGGNRALNGGDTSGSSVIVVGPQNLGTIRIVANASGSVLTGGTGTVTSADFASLLKMIADLTAQFAAFHNAPAKPACPPSGDTSMVQNWLMNNGYAAGFLAAGVTHATGHWGPITTAAYAQASAACK